MQLLFIENREKTHFWAAVAARLQDRGFAIAWAVQNPMFASRLPGRVHLMPFPKGASPDQVRGFEDWPLLVTDRGRDHFAAGHAHYTHYARQLEEIYDKVKPALVLGEATLFHELLAVGEARSRRIPYLHPSAERYPQDRLCFFHDITQHAFGGSGGTYSDSDAREFADRIAEGRVRLSYMRAHGRLGRAARKLKWALSRARIMLGRVSGERYNTPSLARKWLLSKTVRLHLSEWRAMARMPLPGERFILYPMQMAPEANIDVWGRPFNDQVKVIKDLLDSAPADVKVALKCNPKPKYELSAELIALVRKESRIFLLPVEMAMPAAMAKAIGAVTVCGTVGFEAVFGRGRCISLRHPVIADACPTLAAASPQEAVSRLLSDPKAGVGSPDLAVALLQRIYARSYPGYVSDPFSSPECLAGENVERVTEAVVDVAARLEQYPLPEEIPL